MESYFLFGSLILSLQDLLSRRVSLVMLFSLISYYSFLLDRVFGLFCTLFSLIILFNKELYSRIAGRFRGLTRLGSGDILYMLLLLLMILKKKNYPQSRLEMISSILLITSSLMLVIISSCAAVLIVAAIILLANHTCGIEEDVRRIEFPFIPFLFGSFFSLEVLGCL